MSVQETEDGQDDGPGARDLIPLSALLDGRPAGARPRYRAWYLRDWPRSEPIYRTEPIEPFETRWLSAQLGPVMFARVEITAMRWERRLADVRNSDFDPIIVSMMKAGEAQGDFDGRALRETAGTFHFHDLGRASLHVSTASLTYNLVIPRALADERFGPLQDLHGLVVPADQAALTFALAEQVDALLPTLDREQAERLGAMFLDALTVALKALRPRPTDPASSTLTLRRLAAERIEQKLANPEAVTVESLCQALNTTRGTALRGLPRRRRHPRLCHDPKAGAQPSGPGRPGPRRARRHGRPPTGIFRPRPPQPRLPHPIRHDPQPVPPTASRGPRNAPVAGLSGDEKLNYPRRTYKK